MSSSTDTCAWNDTICQYQDESVVVARLSERDLVYPVGIDQVYLPGINANYMASNLEQNLKNALDIGFRAIYLDLDWSGAQWSLGSPEFTVQQVCTVLQDYIGRTDTNLEVGLLRLGLRFNAPRNLTVADQAAMNSSDFTAAIAPISSRLFTPSNLTQLRSAGVVSGEGVSRTSGLWPSLTQVLLTSKQRIFITVEHNIGNTSYTPLAGLAFDGIAWPAQKVDTDNLYRLANMPFRSLSIDSVDAFDSNWGYSPVWNASIGNDTLGGLGRLLQWTWKQGQPTVETSQQRSHLVDNQNYSMCGLQTNTGLLVDNCYEAYPVLCQNSGDPLDWMLTERKCNFFEAVSDGECCPTTHYFSTPKTILESISVRRLLVGNSSAWVAANSLVVQNCWVQNTSTNCPYSIAEGNRNGIGQLVVLGCVGVFLLVAMILLEYRHQRMPLRARRGKKKKKD